MRYPAKGAQSGKCKGCGGATPVGPASPHFKDGKRSKYLFLPDPLARRVEELTIDAIKNLEGNINILCSLETSVMEKLGTGESPEAWKQLADVFDRLDNNKLTMGGALHLIRDIVDGAIAQDSLVARIQSLQESQRKQTETLTKSRKEIQETYTAEQWNLMLEILMRVIHNNVHSKEQLDRITKALVSESLIIESQSIN